MIKITIVGIPGGERTPGFLLLPAAGAGLAGWLATVAQDIWDRKYVLMLLFIYFRVKKT